MLAMRAVILRQSLNQAFLHKVTGVAHTSVYILAKHREDGTVWVFEGGCGVISGYRRAEIPC